LFIKSVFLKLIKGEKTKSSYNEKSIHAKYIYFVFGGLGLTGIVDGLAFLLSLITLTGLVLVFILVNLLFRFFKFMKEY